MVCEQVQAAVGAEGGHPARLGDVVGAVEAIEVECGVVEAGEGLGCGAGAHGGAVLVEGDVAYPVQRAVDVRRYL